MLRVQHELLQDTGAALVSVLAMEDSGAGDEVRTRDILLGRQALYH